MDDDKDWSDYYELHSNSVNHHHHHERSSKLENYVSSAGGMDLEKTQD